VVTAILVHPSDHAKHVYELTGPETLAIDGLAETYTRGLRRPIRGTDIEHDTWADRVLTPLGLAPNTRQHIETMAKLHRADRYNRITADVEEVTGRPAQTVDEFISGHRELLSHN
jgi:hypothetical protein